jgi:4-hydroxybenzoate polyprenyltransferase
MGSVADFGPIYYLGLMAYGIHLFSQARRVRVDDPRKALRLFRSNAFAGLILVLAIVGGTRIPIGF